MFNLKCKTESGRYILGKIEHGQLSGSGVIGLEYFNPMAWESASGTSCPLLKICLRALSPPNLASAKTPLKSRAQFTPSNQWLSMDRCVPRPCKAKKGERDANLQMVGSPCKQFLWAGEQGNVQQGLPVVAAVNKEATKGMCCHFLWSTRRTAKGWV